MRCVQEAADIKEVFGVGFSSMSSFSVADVHGQFCSTYIIFVSPGSTRVARAGIFSTLSASFKILRVGTAIARQTCHSCQVTVGKP
jgi:hypothetical protein